jgi:hypothetical protein
VGGEDGSRCGQQLHQLGEEGDEALLLGVGVGADHGQAAAGAKTDRVRTVVERDHLHAFARQRLNRPETVDPSHLEHDRGRLGGALEVTLDSRPGLLVDARLGQLASDRSGCGNSGEQDTIDRRSQ